MMIRPALWAIPGAALAQTTPGPLVSTWLAMAVGAFVVALLAFHMHALTTADMPESRRRIRTANGWVMLLATPVTAYAFGMATPASPRGFLLAWLSVAGLLAIILVLAGIDIANTGRINLEAKRDLRKNLRERLGGDLSTDPDPPGGPDRGPHGGGTA